jgi:cell division ATPase FtsA
MSKENFSLSKAEYQEKRFRASMEILASIITAEKINSMHEQKQRESMAYSCVQMADALLSCLNYFPKSDTVDGSEIRSISSLLDSLKNSKGDDD